MHRLILFLLFLYPASQAAGQGRADTAAIIDQFFKHYQPQNAGCQVAVSLNGKLIYSKAFGLADVEHRVPYTTQTITEAGSITKQFTAAIILILQQQGRLSVNDDVRKYLPQIPYYGKPMLIRHLLQHTSGLREWSNLAAFTGWPRFTKAYTNADVLDLLSRQQQLNNQPGDEFIYSNSNYVLLTLIAEKVSGLTLSELTRKYLFEPAGMVNTDWRYPFQKVVPNRSIAYKKDSDRYEISMPNENVYGPGALLTTAEDLLKWNTFYISAKIGGAVLLKQQLTVNPLPGGAVSNYACGLYVDSLRGHRMIYHDGQTAGYVAMLENFPDLHLSIAFLSNTTEFKDSLFNEVTKLEDLFVKATGTPGQADVKTVIVPRKTLMAYTGWYRHGKTNQGLKVTLQTDGSLLFNNTTLIPIGQHLFKYRASVIDFNAPGRFTITTADKRLIIFTRQPPTEISLAYLNSFTGHYFSKETDSGFSIMLNDGKLVINQNYIDHVELIPTYQQGFSFYLTGDANLFPQLANMVFTTSPKGAKQVLISMADTRNVKFTKLP
jgi:CubicO group peptidase (beta-lactamase class C family)